MRDSAARVIATGTVCVTPDASFVPRHLSTRGAQCCAEAAPTIGKEGRAGKRSNTASATAQSARAQQQHNKNPMKRETGLDCACRAGRHRATGGRCNQPRRHGRGLQRRQGGGWQTLYPTACRNRWVCPRGHAAEDFFRFKIAPQAPPKQIRKGRRHRQCARQAVSFCFLSWAKKHTARKAPCRQRKNTPPCRHKSFIFYLFLLMPITDNGISCVHARRA